MPEGCPQCNHHGKEHTKDKEQPGPCSQHREFFNGPLSPAGFLTMRVFTCILTTNTSKNSCSSS